MLTEQDKTYLRTAFDAAIKASPDSLAAASVLIPLLSKIESMVMPPMPKGTSDAE